MTDTANPGSTGAGQLGPNDFTDDFNKHLFLIRQILRRLDVMKPVKVVSVTGGGGAIAAAGTVSVQPLYTQLDGLGNAVQMGQVNGIPWWRLQGGPNAIIADPVAGDMGFVICADRDISSVIRNAGSANPGSFRSHNIADGIYVGGILNAAPTQFIAFTSSGLTIQDLNGNVIAFAAGGITITGNVTINGNLTTTGNTTSGTIDLEHHVHTGVTTGSGNTGPPTG